MDRFINQKSIDAYSMHDSPSGRSPSKQSPYGGSPGGYQDNVLEDFEGADYDTTMKLPVKSHITRLEDLLDALRNELEESKKEAQLVRADMMAIEHILKESNNEVARAMMDECLRFEKDFRKTVSVEKSENEFLRQQLAQLNQDKMKLQQNCLVLENRVEGSEHDVGFKQLQEYGGEGLAE